MESTKEAAGIRSKLFNTEGARWLGFWTTEMGGNLNRVHHLVIYFPIIVNIIIIIIIISLIDLEHTSIHVPSAAIALSKQACTFRDRQKNEERLPK
jgi:hypothetical protein